jgi:hypothetical protein
VSPDVPFIFLLNTVLDTYSGERLSGHMVGQFLVF